MKTNRILLMAACVALLAVGCASSKSYNQVSAQFPQIPAGQGRIVVFRGNEFTGSAQRDAVWLNGDKIGSLEPNSFFYLDRPAGDYAISGAAAGFLQIKIRDVPLNISLNAGEIKYVRIRQKSGVAAVGFSSFNTSLEDPDAAMQVLPKCLYAGEK